MDRLWLHTAGAAKREKEKYSSCCALVCLKPGFLEHVLFFCVCLWFIFIWDFVCCCLWGFCFGFGVFFVCLIGWFCFGVLTSEGEDRGDVSSFCCSTISLQKPQVVLMSLFGNCSFFPLINSSLKEE